MLLCFVHAQAEGVANQTSAHGKQYAFIAWVAGSFAAGAADAVVGSVLNGEAAACKCNYVSIHKQQTLRHVLSKTMARASSCQPGAAPHLFMGQNIRLNAGGSCYQLLATSRFSSMKHNAWIVLHTACGCVPQDVPQAVCIIPSCAMAKSQPGRTCSNVCICDAVRYIRQDWLQLPATRVALHQQSSATCSLR
jgi:hypothetical protein